MNQKSILVTFFIVCLCSLGIAQDEKNVKAKLSSATVFFNGAELQHTATASLSVGENELIIRGISPIIDGNSLEIQTSNGSVISQSEFSIDYLNSSNAESALANRLKDSLNIYSKQFTAIVNELKLNTELKELLQKGVNSNIVGSQDRVTSTQEMAALLSFYQTKVIELTNTESKNTIKKEELEKNIKRLKEQYKQEQMKNNKTSGVLRLVLSSPTAGNCTFTINYYTAAASWYPVYDINIVSTDKPIKIVSKSKVRQTTGLDWEQIKLSLSTSNPTSGKVAPLFETWFLDFYNPINYGARKSAHMSNSYSYNKDIVTPNEEILEVIDNSEVMAFEEESSLLYIVNDEMQSKSYTESLDPNMIKDVNILTSEAAIEKYGKSGSKGAMVVTLKQMDDYVVQSDNELNSVFAIDIPYTIPGNGKEQTISLQTNEVTAKYKYYTVPKLAKETYLLAEINNFKHLNLLDGIANVSYAGTYIGQVSLEGSSTKESIPLTLGADKRIAVKREKMQDFSSTKMLGSDKKQVFTYRTTVKNNQKKPVKITVKDQYPVSQQKSIEVELISENTTKWTANIAELGVVTWDDELKPGEVKTYQISYSVKYPKDKTLNIHGE